MPLSRRTAVQFSGRRNAGEAEAAPAASWVEERKTEPAPSSGHGCLARQASKAGGAARGAHKAQGRSGHACETASCDFCSGLVCTSGVWDMGHCTEMQKLSVLTRTPRWIVTWRKDSKLCSWLAGKGTSSTHAVCSTQARVALVTARQGQQLAGSGTSRGLLLWTHVQCHWNLNLVSVLTGLHSPESPMDERKPRGSDGTGTWSTGGPDAEQDAATGTRGELTAPTRCRTRPQGHTGSRDVDTGTRGTGRSQGDTQSTGGCGFPQRAE